MFITETEFKNNVEKYLSISSKEIIYITKEGKIIAKLIGTGIDKSEMAKTLFDILPANASLERARDERLNCHE